MAGDKFKLGDEVRIRRSGERGTIYGRATYVDATPTNFIRYTGNDGTYREAWITDPELELAERDGALVPHAVSR